MAAAGLNADEIGSDEELRKLRREFDDLMKRW
jgi:hypothetical protein